MRWIPQVHVWLTMDANIFFYVLKSVAGNLQVGALPAPRPQKPGSAEEVSALQLNLKYPTPQNDGFRTYLRALG